ncbi:hypothetical protein JTB14_002770 [Gonioctena quinquepunctata]|nr:hypothetical protein JTB14_002770 [Gonioctena quinquepunctata]
MIGRKDSEGELVKWKIPEKKATLGRKTGKKNLNKVGLSLKSHTSARVLQKKLNYETEKKRQEIEMKKAKLRRQGIEMEKAKLENQLRLLQPEHDLQEEEIRSFEEERQSQKMGLEDVQSSMSRVQEWVNNSEENESIRNRSNSQPKITKTQIIDKDFPILCGNPEEWPLFYEQYERVCKMCSFSQEEIMIKLTKCLRGEAKSAVAGMLLASENVPMVKETLKMRFSRPDVIIEVLIAKINCIPYMKERSIEKLIKFSNGGKNLVETMKSLKSVGHMNNPQLLKDLSN